MIITNVSSQVRAGLRSNVRHYEVNLYDEQSNGSVQLSGESIDELISRVDDDETARRITDLLNTLDYEMVNAMAHEFDKWRTR